MDPSNILSQLEQLDDEIEDLEESLEPLLKSALSEITSKLPLLDKAKLYVLAAYAIESILFSYLRLHGVKAREHPVFNELTRVKQYFAKIKNAETPSKPPSMSVDKAAVGRMIKHGLSGNDKYDTERAERIAKEKAKAHIRFNEISKKRKAEESVEEEEEEEEEESSSQSGPEFIGKDTVEEELPGLQEVEVEQPKPTKEEKRAKKKRKSSSGQASASITNSEDEKALKAQRKAERKARKKAEKDAAMQAEEDAAVEKARRKAEKAKKKKEKSERSGAS